jgi:autotransporter-associated beta strand protein
MTTSSLRSIAALAALLAAHSVYALTYTFNGTTTGTAPGTLWSSGTNWSGVPVSASDTSLVFGNGASLAASATVHTSQNIANPFQLNSVTMSYAGPGSGTGPSATINTNALSFVSNGLTTPTINLNATGTVRPQLIFASGVTFSNDTAIGGSSDVLFSGTIANSGGVVVTKSGNGIMRVQSTNAGYTGNFTVSGGTLQVGNNGGSGDIGNGTVTLSSGGGFTVRRNGGALTLNTTVTGTGNLTFQTNAGFTATINRANTYVGNTTISPAGANNIGTAQLGIDNGLSTSSVLTITNNGTSVQTFGLNNFNQTLGGLTTGTGGNATNSKVTLGTGTLTINDASNRTFAGEISGAGNVTKQGAGTWTLSNINTFTGNTTITGGGLTLGAAGSVNASSRVSVGGGASFTNNNASAVTAALALTEGASLAGSGTFTPGSLIVAADLSNGFSTISAGASLAKAGTLTFDLSGITIGTYSLFSGTPTGTYTGVSIGATALSTADANATFTGTVGGFTYLFTNSLNELNVAAIPEPSATAALVGLGVLGVVAGRRRRSA